MTSEQLFLEVPADLIDDMSRALERATPGCVVRSSSSSALRSGALGEILVVGQAALIAALPVIAFYLGRGRKVSIKVDDKLIVVNGYQVDDVLRVVETVLGKQEDANLPPPSDNPPPATLTHPGIPRTRAEILGLPDESDEDSSTDQS